MLPVRQFSVAYVFVGLLITLFLAGCGAGRGYLPPSTVADSPTAFPSSATATCSPDITPLSPTPTPEPTPVIAPTVIAVAPMSWTGPLLYPRWPLDFEQSAIPVYDLGAGRTVWLPTAERVYQVLDWSADGCFLTYTTADSEDAEVRVRLVDIGTLKDRLLFTTPPGSLHSTRLLWSPTGEWIAYVSGYAPEAQACLIRPDGSGQKQFGDSFVEGIDRWTGDGQLLFYWSYYPRLAEGVYLAGTYRVNLLNVSSMSERPVAYLTQPLESWAALVITDVNTWRPVPLAMPGRPEGIRYATLYWTPDFQHLLLLTARAVDEGFGGVRLYLIDVANGTVRPVGIEEFWFESDSQSMDGTWVAFSPAKYLVNIATGEVQKLGQEQGFGYVQWLTWSPDNTMLSYKISESEGGSRFVYRLDTGETIPMPDVLAHGHWPLYWSPRMSYGPGACKGGK